MNDKKRPMGRPLYWNPERLLEEGKAMIEWAQKEDSLVLADFYASRGYDYDDVNEFEKRSPEFSKLKRLAKMIVGARREKGALHGNLDAGLVKKSMALYDPDMKAYELELKNADKKEEFKDVIKDLLDVIRENEARSRNAKIVRLEMENQQSILDQRCSRESDQVSDELGPEGDI